MADLPGPKMRIGTFAVEKIELKGETRSAVLVRDAAGWRYNVSSRRSS